MTVIMTGHARLIKRLERPGALVSASDCHQLRSGYVLLKPGEEVGEHTTGEGEELILIMEDAADITSSGKAETVRAPASVLVSAHSVHNVKNNSEGALWYVYVVAHPA